MKKYIISENQYKYLIELKKNRKVYNDIVNEINQYELYLNESIDLNEAVADVLKKYAKKGLLTTALISSLLSNNVVSANDLISAGVPEDKIENVQDSSKFSHMDILNELIKILKTRGYKRDKAMFENLVQLDDDAQKKITKEISSRINSLDDMWKYKYNILTSQDKDQFDTDKKGLTQVDKEEVVKIDSSFVQTKVEGLEENYENNSAKINNEEQIKNSLEKIFNGYHTIDEIIIKASSNTLRNTGDFENMTWEESSLARANKIKEIVEGINYTLGCDNPVKNIDESIINIDASGENGDGTSGPKSPFEVDDKYINHYKDRNIDEKYWKSNATGKPLDNLKDYEKYNNVTVYVKGVVLEENEKVFRNFKYLQMLKIDTGKKTSIKVKWPKIFKGDKPQIFDGNKVGAKSCPNPQTAYD